MFTKIRPVCTKVTHARVRAHTRSHTETDGHRNGQAPGYGQNLAVTIKCIVYH